MEDWQKLHWKSIKNTYQSSPISNFTKISPRKIFRKTLKPFGIQFEGNRNNFTNFKTRKAILFTEEYQKSPEMIDFRSVFSAKRYRI